MIPKREKYPMDISSYTPISVLPTISKVPEKNVYPKKINKYWKTQDWNPKQQSALRQAQYTAQQCHCITDAINTATEKQHYCTAAIFRRNTSIRKCVAPRPNMANIQNQKNFTLRLFHPAEIVAK